MCDLSLLNKMKQLVPLLSKITLFELGIIIFIIFSLCKTNNFVPLSKIISSNNELFSNGVYVSYILVALGIIRKVTVIDLSYNFSQNRGTNIDAKFLHLYELKMVPAVQVPLDVSVKMKLLKVFPDFIAEKIIEKINFFIVFTYFSDQIDLDTSSDEINVDENRDLRNGVKIKKKISIKRNIGKPEVILPILILPRNYEEKELFINLLLEPVKSNKLFYNLLIIFSYLLFPWKKLLIIS